jgi:hypothetical protein
LRFRTGDGSTIEFRSIVDAGALCNRGECPSSSHELNIELPINAATGQLFHFGQFKARQEETSC